MIFGLMRLSKNAAIQGIATVYIEFFRGTSLLVQLFWAYYVLPFFGVSLEAFSETAYYDAVIADYFNRIKKNKFPQKKVFYGNA